MVSPCSPGCPGTHSIDQGSFELRRTSCLCLPSAGIKGMYYHCLAQRTSFISISCRCVYAYLSVHVSHKYKCPWVQKWLLDPLKPGLQTVVSCPVWMLGTLPSHLSSPERTSLGSWFSPSTVASRNPIQVVSLTQKARFPCAILPASYPESVTFSHLAFLPVKPVTISEMKC